MASPLAGTSRVSEPISVAGIDPLPTAPRQTRRDASAKRKKAIAIVMT
jgi:hypothetical protein